jgi:hypothetical protein
MVHSLSVSVRRSSVKAVTNCISSSSSCMSKGFSCSFLDLTVRHSPQGLSCDIFDNHSQPECAGIEMIRMPHVHSNISMTVKLGLSVVNFTDS